MKYLQIALVAMGLSVASISTATAARVNVPDNCFSLARPCVLGPLDTSSPLQIIFRTSDIYDSSAWEATVPTGWRLKNIGLDFIQTESSTISGSVDAGIGTGNWFDRTVSLSKGNLRVPDLTSGQTFSIFAVSPKAAFDLYAYWEKDPVATVPLPAGGLLLLTGLAGLGAARRKKRS